MKLTALNRRRPWVIGALLLLAAAVVVATTHYFLSGPGAGAPAVFRTLPPGASLPSGSQCARRVRASPSPETRPANKIYNHTVGQHVGPGFFPTGDSPQAQKLARRISGDFTGTTGEILRWAACKWGISQDVVFAQAAVESWWWQDQVGDWGTNPQFCPQTHGIGAEGIPGECPQSYGILQNKYPFEKSAWPGIGASTAMNADAAYAIWRSCYDGYEIWLNDGAAGQRYHAGDLWGCVGRWFAGSWYTPAAIGYIRQVQGLLRDRIWRQSSFVRAG